MNEAEFWHLIEITKEQSDGDIDKQEELIREELANLTAEKVVDEIYLYLRHLSYTRELWGAAVLINAGCSEDSFIDFRGWLMLQGKEVFYRALQDPDSLSEIIPVYEIDTEIPLDSRIAEAYYNLTGSKDVPPPKKQLKYVLKGKKWENFEELASWFPKLVARFYALYGAMPPRHIFLHLDQF